MIAVEEVVVVVYMLINDAMVESKGNAEDDEHIAPFADLKSTRIVKRIIYESFHWYYLVNKGLSMMVLLLMAVGIVSDDLLQSRHVSANCTVQISVVVNQLLFVRVGGCLSRCLLIELLMMIVL